MSTPVPHEGDYELELAARGSGTFLNYWDSRAGFDVVCEVVDGRLMLHDYDESGDPLPDREITVGEFIDLVRQREP